VNSIPVRIEKLLLEIYLCRELIGSLYCSICVRVVVEDVLLMSRAEWDKVFVSIVDVNTMLVIQVYERYLIGDKSNNDRCGI
jgi:hypothetical protein